MNNWLIYSHFRSICICHIWAISLS